VAAPSAPLVSIAGANVTGLSFEGVAINDAGQVAGTQNPTQNPELGPSRAMLYTPGAGVQDLGTLGGTMSVAYALNELGQVVGYSTTETGARHAFRWTPGVGMQDLGTVDGGTASIARGINDRGEVVGQNVLPRTDAREPQTHAFLWTPAGGMQDLGALGGGLTSSIAFDVNNAGQVVGRSYSADQIVSPPTDPEFFSRAFLWSPGQGMQDLGALSGGHAVAYAINDAGQVVGKSWLSTSSPPPYGPNLRAVLWEPGNGIHDLGGLWNGPYNGAAYGINEAGQVVGESDLGIAFLDGFPLQAFLWTAADGMEALSPTTGLTTARDINNHQQVVGDGRIAALHLTPGNDQPVAITGGPYTGTEGSPVVLDVSARDNDDVGFDYRVSFGDGTPDWFDIRLPSSALNHVYADNGTYTLTLTVRDPKGASDTKATTVTIANVAPTILEGSLTGPAAPIQLADGGASAPISFEFSDMAGKQDVYAAEVACGNGVMLTATDIPVTETFRNGEYTGGRGTYSGACPYTSAGVYTVRATVSDGDGGTSAPAFFRYVIVYDPAGGSTTGGGFYTVSGQGNRKAHFTFDVSFPNHGTVPNGSVQLWIPGGEMRFESTAIELLVVSGNRAQFWGTGTLNGVAARFRITAMAGTASGHGGGADAIRIELWDASGATVLYDTQPGAAQDAPVTTPTDGGNIRIRGN
jgi:probable HAF family extracellular repeat protein